MDNLQSLNTLVAVLVRQRELAMNSAAEQESRSIVLAKENADLRAELDRLKAEAQA